MITEAILSNLFLIAKFLIGLLPEALVDAFEGTTALGTVLAYALIYFPMDIWIFGLGAIISMMTITLVYAILEWVWKKIPGVD